MAIGYDLTSFAAGEISPSLYGHTDLAKFSTAANTVRNMYVGYRGGLYSRAGTLFCARAKQGDPGAPPRVIRFQFSVTQGYSLEFGDNYMRVFSNGGAVVEPGVAVTGVALANPVQVTIPGNTYAAGDWIVLQGLGGTWQLDANTYIVAGVAGAVVTLSDLDYVPVDATGFVAYSGGGYATRVFTLATPYLAVDLPLLKFTQSADVMSLVHPNYPPYDLSRMSALNWTMLPTQFASSIAAPAFCSVSATTPPSRTTSPPTLPAGYAYVATAVNAVTGEESIASPVGTCVNGVDIAQTAGSNVITIAHVVGAGSYNIYKAPTSYNTNPGNTAEALPPPAGSSFGYAATIFGTQFVDSNQTPTVTQVPPKHRNPFATGAIIAITIVNPGGGYLTATVTMQSATGSGFIGQVVLVTASCVAVIVDNGGSGYRPGDTAVFAGTGSGAGFGTASANVTIGPQTGTYPGCVAYYQQRRVYASSLNSPDTYWMSQPGAFQNFDSSIPVTDGDAIVGTPWSQQVNGVQAMVPMPGGLVVLTGSGAWQVGGAGGSTANPQAITPSNQQAQPQAFNGCSPIVPPIPVGNDILYVQSKGSKLRDLNYNFYLNIYTGVDLTQISGHLFWNFSIREMAWCEEPFKLLWAVRSDNTLLSLTYLKEQEVYGWARHDTAGRFFSVCSTVERETDALYLVTQRQRGGAGMPPAYYIERMDDRGWTTIEDCWCVDAGLRLPMVSPGATLSAYLLAGRVTFYASAPVFAAGDVGKIIRASGTMAVVVQFINAAAVLVSVLRTTAEHPDVAGARPMMITPSGAWTMDAPVTRIGGLWHLVGLQVTGLADGAPIPLTTVGADGSIALPFPATSVTVGLPFQAQFQSTYANVPAQPTEQGRRKDIVAATVRVNGSAGLKAGTNQVDGATLYPPKTIVQWSNMTPIADQGESYATPGGGTARQLYTGDERVNLYAAWRKPGQVALQQDNPLPMGILDVVPEAVEGDAAEQAYAQRAPHDPREVRRGPGLWMLAS